MKKLLLVCILVALLLGYSTSNNNYHISDNTVLNVDNIGLIVKSQRGMQFYTRDLVGIYHVSIDNPRIEQINQDMINHPGLYSAGDYIINLDIVVKAKLRNNGNVVLFDIYGQKIVKITNKKIAIELWAELTHK